MARTTTWRRRLVIMVREPVAGRTKTRLARDIGQAAALRFYRANLRAVTRRLANDPRWQTVLSVEPARAIRSRAFLDFLPRSPQVPGDIGQRMQAALAAPLPAGPATGPVVLIGSDIPAVRPAHIADAFRLLGRNDLVFGPSADGGFWLVGMRRSPRMIEAFPAPVSWSSPDTLAECMDALPGLRIGLAATLSDTDAAADLHRLGGAAGRLVSSSRPGADGCFRRP
jgi:rSAM/selenodomain-associated transferase 1